MIFLQLGRYLELQATTLIFTAPSVIAMAVRPCIIVNSTSGSQGISQKCVARLKLGGMHRHLGRGTISSTNTAVDGRNFGGCPIGTRQRCLLLIPCIVS